MRRQQHEPAAPGAATVHPAVIRLDNVTKAYQGSVTKAYQQGGRPALAEVSITVAAGEVAAIMGPSGSGKSTLLNLIAGLDRPTQGTVTVAGQRIDKLGESALARFRARHIGFIFQFFNLLDDLTVSDNVLLPAQLAGAPGRGRPSCSTGWAWPISATPTRRGCRAGSGSASRSRGRWSTRPSCCSRTSPPVRSTPRPARRSAVC